MTTESSSSTKTIFNIIDNNAMLDMDCPLCGVVFTPDLGPWPIINDSWHSAACEDCFTQEARPDQVRQWRLNQRKAHKKIEIVRGMAT